MESLFPASMLRVVGLIRAGFMTKTTRREVLFADEQTRGSLSTALQRVEVDISRYWLELGKRSVLFGCDQAQSSAKVFCLTRNDRCTPASD